MELIRCHGLAAWLNAPTMKLQVCLRLKRDARPQKRPSLSYSQHMRQHINVITRTMTNTTIIVSCHDNMLYRDARRQKTARGVSTQGGGNAIYDGYDKPWAVRSVKHAIQRRRRLLLTPRTRFSRKGPSPAKNPREETLPFLNHCKDYTQRPDDLYDIFPLHTVHDLHLSGQIDS